MNPFWVETGNELRIAIVPRPRGGDWLEDEVWLMKRAGVDVLVSMLEADEASELGLSDESEVCKAVGIAFHQFPITDRETPPSIAASKQFIDVLRTEAHAGRRVAVHCRASIGRSSLLLAALLCTEGFTVEDAFARLSAARGIQVPDTWEQIRWVERFAQVLPRTSTMGG